MINRSPILALGTKYVQHLVNLSHVVVFTAYIPPLTWNSHTLFLENSDYNKDIFLIEPNS